MLYVITFLAIFFAGFISGKYYGMKAGYQEGQSAASLLLRQQSMEQGYCVLCHVQQSMCPEANNEGQ